MREIIIKPSIRRRCQIAMCGNTVTNSISRTSAPAQASFFMCDECLREAYNARFSAVSPSDHTDERNAMLAHIKQLQARVTELEASPGNCKGAPKTAQKQAETPVNAPAQAETPKQDKPKGGKKK